MLTKEQFNEFWERVFDRDLTPFMNSNTEIGIRLVYDDYEFDGQYDFKANTITSNLSELLKDFKECLVDIDLEDYYMMNMHIIQYENDEITDIIELVCASEIGIFTQVRSVI